MKVIIAGSRSITDINYVYEAVKKAYSDGIQEIDEVVSGTARGVDRLGEEWAKRNKIPIKKFPADYWLYHPSIAPKKRNEQMACYADALIAVWNGCSGGTHDMIQRAYAHNLRVSVYIIPEDV